jgi:hypothetical protein
MKKLKKKLTKFNPFFVVFVFSQLMTDYVAPIEKAQKLNEKEPISELPSSLFQIEEGTLSKEIAEWEPEDREKVFFQKFFFQQKKN